MNDRFLMISLILLLFVSSCLPTVNTKTVKRYQEKVFDIPDSWKNRPIIGLEERVEIDFQYDKNGNYVMIKELKWIYINKKFPNHLDWFYYYETEFIEEIKKIDIQVFYPDKAPYRISMDMPGQIEKRRIIEGDYLYLADIPGYDKGIIIRIEFLNRVTRPEFISTFTLRNRYPQLKKSIRFRYPKDCEINFGFENHEKLDVKRTRGFDDEPEYKYFELEGEKIPEYSSARIEMPEKWYAALFLSLPPKGKKSYSWKQLGDHYLDLIEDSIVDSEKIKNLAKKISRKSKNNAEILEDSFNEITKRIRYYADEQGKYGFIPRGSKEIFEKGYGDCKEISTVLKVLLESNNIGCSLALVKTHGHSQLLKKYPSLGCFNHMIAFSKTEQGLNFYDGTDAHGNVRNSYYWLIGRNALLLMPGKSTVEMIKKSGDFKNEITTVSKVIYQRNAKRWIIDCKMRLQGKSALDLYHEIKTSPTTQKTSVINEYLQKNFGLNPYDIRMEIKNCDNINLGFNNSFQENYISLDQGGFRLNVPSIYEFNAINKEKKIHGRLYFDSFVQKDTWIFPYNISELSAEKENSGLSVGTIEYHKNKVNREYKQISKKHIIGLDEFESLKNNQSKILGAIVWK